MELAQRSGAAARHALVVEDDPTERLVYASMVGQVGLTVDEAGDAPSAIARLGDPAAPSPELILLDVDLDGSSGLDVLRWIRGRDSLRTTPVILLTGHDDVEARVAGLMAGASDYVGKPVDPRELRARVDAQLRVSTSWHGIIADDQRHRVDLAEAIADLARTTSCADLRAQVERAVGCLPGVVEARILSLHPPSDAADAVHVPVDGRPVHPSIVSDKGTVVVRVPLIAAGAAVGVLALRHLMTVPTPPARLLASAVDAATVIAPLLSDRLLGPSALAVTHREVRRLLERHRFHPVFQPIIDLRSQDVVGYEGLTRFDDGPPDQVFGDARRVGLSHELQLSTLRATIAASTGLADDAYLALNVSADLLTTHDLAPLLPSDRSVLLEITEHERIEDYAAVRAAIDRLGEGVRVGVDDAGAGFASLQHILSLGPDVIKLDRSLVQRLHDRPAQEAMIAGLVHFARRAGVRLIAEGVEHPEEAAAARDLGVHYGQGYHFGRPVPSEQPDVLEPIDPLPEGVA